MEGPSLLITRPDDVPLSADVEPYMDEEMSKIKNRLDESKSKLDSFENLKGAEADAWWKIRSTIDVYKSLRYIVAKDYGAQIVTNAWLKYHELYSRFPNLIPAGSDLKVFFNAELPGAALCAFNHYFKTYRPRDQFEWRASSLWPDASAGTAALGDNYGLYAANKDNWLMSPGGNNGDATKVSNLLDWEAKIGPSSAWGGVHMYSHDAGIDVSTDYNRQEEANAQVHLGCALAGLITLRVGGSFIAKQYTYFLTITRDLILIYSSLFEKFYLSKPLTSRGANSEVYLVGIGFKGLPTKIRAALFERLENWSTSPFIDPAAIRVMLTQQYNEIGSFARTVFIRQALLIDESVMLWEKYRRRPQDMRHDFAKLHQSLIKNWLKRYPVRPIRRAQLLAAK